MQFLFTKNFIRFIIGLCILIVLACASVAVKYFNTSKKPAEILDSKIEFYPDLQKGIKLGETVNLVWIFKSPWGAYPVEIGVHTGKGSQQSGKTIIHRRKILWGKSEWEILVKIQPYTVGKIEKGNIVVRFNKALTDKSKKLEHEIPEFNALALEVDNPEQLAIADKISEPIKSKQIWKFVIALIIVGIIAFAIWHRYFLRSAKAKPVIPPWQIAILELYELRKELNEKSLSFDKCINRLTDIVRSYLEKRFKIKAPAQTTPEFLNSMKRSGGPLEPRHKEFLSEFLQSADLVKFAKLPADTALIEDAMKKAEDLVKSTIPSEQEIEKMADCNKGILSGNKEKGE